MVLLKLAPNRYQCSPVESYGQKPTFSPLTTTKIYRVKGILFVRLFDFFEMKTKEKTQVFLNLKLFFNDLQFQNLNRFTVFFVQKSAFCPRFPAADFHHTALEQAHYFFLGAMMSTTIGPFAVFFIV